jgi:hypothetical protein
MEGVMNIIQKLYNKIRGIKTPLWYVELGQFVQNLIMEITMQIGKEAMESIKNKIIEVSDKDISNKEKFDKVFDFARKELMLTIKDRWINLIIETLVNQLKKKRII